MKLTHFFVATSMALNVIGGATGVCMRALCLSLSLLLSLQAHAAPSDPTATAVPTLTQSPSQEPEACIDSEALSAALGAILPTNVACNEYKLGEGFADPNSYVCRDFARDECLEQRKSGMRAWKLGFGVKTEVSAGARLPSTRSPLGECIMSLIFRCAGGSLIGRCWRAPDGKGWMNPENYKKFEACALQRKYFGGPIFSGHAVVTIDVTDAETARAGLHKFAIYEPQVDATEKIKAGKPNGDGSSILNPHSKRIYCAWTQRGNYPVVPDACINKLDQFTKEELGLNCPEVLNSGGRHLQIYNCNENMDKYDHSPQPSPTPVRGSPRGNEMWGR